MQDDLKAKDSEYAAKEAERAFTDSVKSTIKAAGENKSVDGIQNG